MANEQPKRYLSFGHSLDTGVAGFTEEEINKTIDTTEGFQFYGGKVYGWTITIKRRNDSLVIWAGCQLAKSVYQMLYYLEPQSDCKCEVCSAMRASKSEIEEFVNKFDPAYAETPLQLTNWH